MVWAWVSKNEAETEALMAVFEDIESSNDRAAAIVTAAILEDNLGVALQKRFHHDEKILNEVFRSSGPLGSFSAKINLAFLIGLCSKEAHKELHIIKDIRNEFAHKILTRDFGTQRVRDLANNLTFGKRWKITIARADESSDAKPSEPIEAFEEKPTTPREHYIKACQMLLTMILMTQSSNPVSPTTPEF